ncbi:MAG TPA: DEAD/DEAH box helicase [Bacillota bacterium]|nr:DEAD/DEAH box helicase [Bacillota bacterium]
MTQIKISDQVIQKIASDPGAFQRGFLYFLKDKVSQLQFDPEKRIVKASVMGQNEYRVIAAFSREGVFAYSHCTCPEFALQRHACKHVVAVLKKLQQEVEELLRTPGQQGKKAGQLLTAFENIGQEKDRVKIRLEILFEYGLENQQPFSAVEFRIGGAQERDRLYTLKNLKDFLTSFSTGQVTVLGKKFTFDPARHTFSDANQAIVDLMLELLEFEKLLNNLSNPTLSAPIFASSTFNKIVSGSSNLSRSLLRGKKAYLTDSFVKRLFAILEKQAFPVVILGREYPSIMIEEADVPLDFTLSLAQEELLFECNTALGAQSFVPLTCDYAYFFYKDRIYHPSLKQRQSLGPLYDHMLKEGGQKTTFTNRDKERFVSEALPLIQQMGLVRIDPLLQESIYQAELTAKIFFDQYQDGISARLEFHYGDFRLIPFTANESVTAASEKILIRDVEKERSILNFFEQAEFIVTKDLIYLTDEAKIFEFIYDILPKLAPLAEVFYSEGFLGFRIKKPHSIGGSVRLNQHSRMLEFSFSLDGIDSQELGEVFTSFREKKRYHRLRDGMFLPLEDLPRLGVMAKLAEQLELGAHDFETRLIEIPQYRAMFVNQLLEDSEWQGFERNRAYQQLVRNILEPEEMEFEVPTPLHPVLRDYQKAGFKWLKTLSWYGLGGILADDMGLGKTLQVLTLLLDEKKERKLPSLVIAPTSLLYNWRDEVKKFTPELKVVIITGVPKTRQEQIQEIVDADLVVTSYPLIRRDLELYREFEFAYCILDEAQHIKNPHTLNAQTVKQINAKCRFALTGTPIENSLTELWSIFDFLMPGYLWSHGKFVNKFEAPIIKARDQEATQTLGRHIRPFILRRMKRDVLQELPEKIESKMTVEMTEAQKKVYLAYLGQARQEIAQELRINGFSRSQIKILSALTRLRQICCHPSLFLENFEGESGKMLLLQEIIADALESGHRLLIFSQFTTMLSLIKSYLDLQQISYFYLDGSIKTETRLELVHAFNQGEGQIFLISLKAGGTGLNLTGADMVIHVDPWWNPAVEDQATDRAYRIGQKNVVQVFKLITEGTIEEKIFELQQKKKEIIQTLIQPGETFVNKLSEVEIRELFELESE